MEGTLATKECLNRKGSLRLQRGREDRDLRQLSYNMMGAAYPGLRQV